MKPAITGVLVQSISPKRAPRGHKESQQITNDHSVLGFAHARDTQNKNNTEKKLSPMFPKGIHGALGLL